MDENLIQEIKDYGSRRVKDFDFDNLSRELKNFYLKKIQIS